MCGIAGVVTWTDRPPSVTADAAAHMVKALSHRGPDGRGVRVCTSGETSQRPLTVVLGHTRLAIIDLSERGAQPMASPDGNLVVTFNGEIYNFPALRGELQTRGHVFRSNSDTEVLLHGYREWGDAMVDRLRGMFAFAIWDDARRRLLLARDRFGIKPLYVYRDREHLLFASEIRALLASGLVPRRLDPIALDDYFAYQTTPAPRTLVAGVTMIEPGHVVVCDESRATTSREYWNLLDTASVQAGGHGDEATARTRALLEESIALHLVSDVPVGMFLSGGMDSGALAGLVRHAGVTPRTFTVACPDTAFDESAAARETARAVGADHTEIVLSAADLRDSLPEALDSADHPSGDGINTYIVSRAVRAHGIKVALSGLGGDEIFGGYPSFHRLRRLASVAPAWRRSPASLRSAAAAVTRAIGGASVTAMKTADLIEGDGSLAQAFPITRQLFSRRQRRTLLAPAALAAAAGHADPYVAGLDDAFARHGDLDLIALVSYAEARTYMHDVLLRDTDQMSMRHGLEVRVPLLDHELAAYVVSLPDGPKRSDGRPKPLLAVSLGSDLPASTRMPKRGFVLPFAPWMRGDLRGFCEAQLFGPSGLTARSIVQSATARSLWQDFVDDNGRVTWSRPWTLVALNAWLDRTDVTL